MAKPKSLNINSNAEAAELESLLKNGNVTIVVILAEWCGACQRVKPDWLNTLKRKNKHNVALIDSEVLPNTVLNDKLNVTHFPSVFEVQPNGKATLLKNVSDPNAVVNSNTKVKEQPEPLNSLGGNSLLELNEHENAEDSENTNKNKVSKSRVFTPSLEKLKGGRRTRSRRVSKRRVSKRRSNRKRRSSTRR